MGIRPATSSDFDAVLTLVNELLVELGGEAIGRGAALAPFARLAAGQEGFVLAYEKDHSLVGVCTVSLVQAIRSAGPYVIIQEMYVIPEMRGEGIGAELVQEAASRARSLGCTMIELGTPLAGERQERLYARLGFEKVGSRLRRRLIQ